jgi:hypothetical protein
METATDAMKFQFFTTQTKLISKYDPRHLGNVRNVKIPLDSKKTNTHRL